MDISTVLSFHLAGAVVFAGALLTAAGLMMSKKDTYHRWAAAGITGLTVWEIGTGVALSVMTSDSILATCAKAGIYLTLAAVANYFLLRPQIAISKAEADL